MTNAILSGKRVLVVEDEMMIAMLLEDMLIDLGCEVVGIASRLDDALLRAQNTAFDIAILDVNLNGQTSYAVADALVERGLPFVFATGYGSGGLTPRYQHITTLQKPFQISDLIRALSDALAAG